MMPSIVLSLEYSQLKSQINNPLDKENNQVNQHIYLQFTDFIV